MDRLRISSDEKNVFGVPDKNTNYNFLQQIQMMTPSTLYIMASTVLMPAVKTICSQFHEKKIIQKIASSEIDFDPKSLTKILKELNRLKPEFRSIETKMIELKRNYKKIMELLTKNKEGSNLKDIDLGLWSLDDSKVQPGDSSNWRRHDGIFGRFFAAKEFIKDKLTQIKKSLASLKKNLPTHPLVKKIEEAIKSLQSQISSPSSKWDKKTWTYDGKQWIHIYTKNREESDQGSWIVHWKGDKDSTEKVENPINLLEMTQDPEKLTAFLNTITESIDKIDKFNTNDIHFLILNSLNTAEAYMYLILTIFPALQNQSAKNLETQGKTMKVVSEIYDKWNLLQDIINTAAKGKSKDTSEQLKLKIENIGNEIEDLLEKVKKDLPGTTESLVTTMKELTQQLVTKFPKDFYKIANDSDQTAFKSYMDILGQGTTALTSISNMTQQALQISTQYYNSLLGLQKNALESLNKVIQIATKNPNY